MKLNILSILAIARKHLTENSNGSDRYCMQDAVRAHDRGDISAAYYWSLKSLQHSVGIFHSDYRKVESSIVRCANATPKKDILVRSTRV